MPKTLPCSLFSENLFKIFVAHNQYLPFRPEPTCPCGRMRIRKSHEDNKKEFFETDGDYIELCVKDLKLVMENQNVQLKKFRLMIQTNEELRKQFIDCAEKIFESAKISTRTVQTQLITQTELAQLLPIFHVGKLEKISFDGNLTDG